MHKVRWLLTGALACPLVMWTAGPLPAQDADQTIAADEVAAAVISTDEDLLDEGALDDLVAPIALYPDALLTQIFVGATYPLDVVKADRFIADNPDLSDKDRNARAGEQDWDPSIAALAGGFPTVIQRMAEDIDWTEELGDAMLAQTDDVLDAVQRMRARAQATGYLADNEAQVVEDDGDNISIQPADPDVVYVPSYDSTAAYTTAPTAAPVVQQQGMTTSGVLTTGAIAFGSALLINEIFDDNDNDWDYWHGPSHIDWDNGDFYPGRGGVNVNGDVNIDRNRVRIGDNDRTRIDRDGAWRPDPVRQNDARNKLADRKRNGGGNGDLQKKLSARSDDSGARGKLEAANKNRVKQGKPEIGNSGKGLSKSSALKPGDLGGNQLKAASDRGSRSAAKAKLPAATKPAVKKPAVNKPAVKKAAASHPKAVSRPKVSEPKAPPRKAPPRTSAFNKSSSGNKTRAASSRGHSSHGSHRTKRR